MSTITKPQKLKPDDKNWSNWQAIRAIETIGTDLEINAGVIGTPENVVVDDNKIPGNGVALVKHVLVDALDVVHRHRQRFSASE